MCVTIENIGQNRTGDVKERKDIFAPLKAVDVEQHCARGIGHIGHMGRASRQMPNQPSVHCAKGQFARPGAFAGIWDFI